MRRSAVPLKSPWLDAAAWLAAAGLLAIGIAGVWPWISDDAFISLRYSQRLLAGQGLSWTDGEFVEGYSNLSWVLLAAGMQALGIDAVAAVRALGVACTLATLLAIIRCPWLRGRGLAAAGGALVLAAMAPVALWAIGGLEAPMAMLLVTIGYLQTGRVLAGRHEHDGIAGCRTAGLAFALLAWTRPDGPLWGALAATAIALFARRGPGAAPVLRRRLFAIAVPIAVAMAAQMAFRLAYYGDWVPNTAHAKVASSLLTLELGAQYMASAAVILRCLLVPAAIGAVLGALDPRMRPFALLCTASVIAWSAYTAAIGGDLFPLCRVLLPALGPLALLAGLGLHQLARRRAGVLAAWALTAASVVAARTDARLDPADPFQRLSQWEWEGRAVGEWLGKAFAAERPLLALDAAGAVPFYSGLPCLDMLGLCDRHIAKAPLPRPDHVLPGHSRGDGRYVLDRAPDLVLFASPTGDVAPRWPGGWQMEDDERFLRHYRCVLFRTGPVAIVGRGEQDLDVAMWVRLDGRAGVQPRGDAWIVPGFLLGGHRQAVPLHLHAPDAVPPAGAVLQQRAEAGLALQRWRAAPPAVGVLAAAGRGLHGAIQRAGTIVLEGLPLPAGEWEAVADPAVPGVRMVVVLDNGRFDLHCIVAAEATLPTRVAAVRLSRR